MKKIKKNCNIAVTIQLDILVKQMEEKENENEELKANNQLEWVARMNNIKNRAEEIVLNEVIYQ